MIADKILPAFYIVDVDGQAALDFIFGKSNLSHAQFASYDFKTDIEAVSAAEDAMEFIVDSSQVKIDNVEKAFNPDFFPTLDAIEVSEEMKAQEEECEARARELSERDGTISATIITKRFDALGDFIACRTVLRGEDSNITMKIGVNPRHYILEKQTERQYGKSSSYQLHVH